MLNDYERKELENHLHGKCDCPPESYWEICRPRINELIGKSKE